MYKCKYFKITELVHPDLLKQYGEAKCWLFFDDRILRFADYIREKYGSVIINGSGLTNCGARTMGSTTGASMSAHKMFRALDLHIVKIEKESKDKAEKAKKYKEVRAEILKNKDWECICFETTDTNGTPIWWLHCDTYNRDKREYNA